MEEFYGIYYLALTLLHTLLPLIFWFWSVSFGKTKDVSSSQVDHYKKELRGHLLVSLSLSFAVLSFIPLLISQIDKGDAVLLNGGFIIVLIGLAGFFIWLGLMQAKSNRRSLAEARIAEEQEKK